MIKLYTIGHSNHSLDQFIRLLEENGIMTLVDVRSAPYSRYNPHFNKSTGSGAARARHSICLCRQVPRRAPHRPGLLQKPHPARRRRRLLA